MQKTNLIAPEAIGTPIAFNGDKNIPSQTAGSTDTSSISAGFLPITSEPLDEGGIAPERTDFNGMFYLSTDQRFYLQNGGRITFDANVSTKIGGYPKDAILDYLNSDGVYMLVRSLIDNNTYNFITNPDYIDGEHWESIQLGGNSRNIGEIVTSTIPLTDAGLHLLDGSVLSGDGIYKNFVDFIAEIYQSSSNYFTSEVDWLTSVSQYGSCGKFVYDSTNNTVRLPKITNILQGTNDVNSLGSLVAAGLPNITGSMSGINNNIYSGALSFQSAGGDLFDRSDRGGIGTWGTISFNASNSSSIYGNSTTVQPQTIKVFYYIVVATDTKTQIQVDIDEIVTDLSNKANKDLSNCTQPYITETYVNGTSWYRVYSDGWCEQGGRQSINNNGVTVTYLKPFKDTNYSIVISQADAGSSRAEYYNTVKVNTKNATNFIAYCGQSEAPACDWHAFGYIN